MTLSPDIDIYGSREAAEYLGLSPGAFYVRLHESRAGRGAHPLPEPMWVLSATPVWTREQLDEWKEEAQRAA